MSDEEAFYFTWDLSLFPNVNCTDCIEGGLKGKQAPNLSLHWALHQSSHVLTFSALLLPLMLTVKHYSGLASNIEILRDVLPDTPWLKSHY